MKLALVQQRASADRAINRKHGLLALRRAAAEGAELVVFAELGFDPFWPRVPAGKDSLSLAETIPGPTTDAFADLARELGVVVVLNLYERAGEVAYDSSPVLDADGKLLGVTRMVHITEYPGFHEQSHYAPGDRGAPVYDTVAGRIGVAICYDRHYPEYLRALALGGADLVVVPQAGTVDEWPDGLYEAELRVAAFQNGYFVALCNRVGKEGELDFAGESFVCDPWGRVLARAGRNREGILQVEVDLDTCASSPARRLFLRDRRPEVDADWLSHPGSGAEGNLPG